MTPPCAFSEHFDFLAPRVPCHALAYSKTRRGLGPTWPWHEILSSLIAHALARGIFMAVRGRIQVPGKYQLVELLDLHKLGHKFFAFQTLRLACVIGYVWVGRDESKRQGLNLSGSWQQGHSATYNTPSRI